MHPIPLSGGAVAADTAIPYVSVWKSPVSSIAIGGIIRRIRERVDAGGVAKDKMRCNKREFSLGDMGIKIARLKLRARRARKT